MKILKKYWWKVLCVFLMSWVVVGGLLTKIPAIPKLNESARNLFYHVPMWYVMIVCFLCSMIYAIKFLRKSDSMDDLISLTFIKVGVLFGSLGMLTGMLWASVTWGSPWSNDPKQVGAGLCLLTYFAYLVLRNSVKEESQKARIASVYNVFAFALIVPLLFIIPARMESLHPATGADNPLKVLYDSASEFRKVTLPAMAGWILLGLWIFDIKLRISKLERLNEENN